MPQRSPVDESLKQTGLPDGAIVLNIGIALQYAFAQPGVKCWAPYLEMGKELWASAEYELHSLLCDSAARAPKKWLEDVVSGDVRELTVSILTILVASLHVPLSIAVPIAALVVKKQVGGVLSPQATKTEANDVRNNR
jgi:hypothetical protein